MPLYLFSFLFSSALSNSVARMTLIFSTISGSLMCVIVGNSGSPEYRRQYSARRLLSWSVRLPTSTYAVLVNLKLPQTVQCRCHTSGSSLKPASVALHNGHFIAFQLPNQRPIPIRLFRRNHHRRRDPISRLDVYQPHTLRRPSRFADELRFHADDLAVLRDQHHLGFLTYLRNADDFSIAFRSLDVDHALAAAIGEAIFIGGGALPVSVLSYRKNKRAFFRDEVGDFGSDIAFFRHRFRLGLDRGRHADDVIFLAEIHAAHAGSVASHRTHVVLVKANRLSIVRREEYDLVAVSQRGRDQFGALFNVDGDDAALHHVREVFHRSLLHRAIMRGKEYIPALFFQIPHREHGAYRFARLQADQVADVLPFAGSRDVGNLIKLQPVHAPRVGEDQNVSVGRGDEQMLNEILVARLHARAPSAAAPLHAVGRNRCAFHVAV